MNVEELVLKYFPLGKDDSELHLEKGESSWWLGRADKADQEFPDQLRLQALFRTGRKTKTEMGVIRRGSNHLIISLPAGLRKNTRQTFLAGIAQSIP